jgi:hypothetical protein
MKDDFIDTDDINLIINSYRIPYRKRIAHFIRRLILVDFPHYVRMGILYMKRGLVEIKYFLLRIMIEIIFIGIRIEFVWHRLFGKNKS